MATILMVGLDDGIAQQVEKITSEAAHDVSRTEMKRAFEVRLEADLVFLAGDQPEYLTALRSIRSHLNPPPVVIVTRLPEISHWLDALEAGAADYCSAPFEALQIRWILDAALRRPKAFAAA